MKQFTFFLMLVALMSEWASAQSEVTVTNEGSDDFANFAISLPEQRPMLEGSKIVVNYSGEWPEEMRGAFEYATKIWEEVLPPTTPIRINASCAPMLGGMNALSRVSFHASEYTGDSVRDYLYPTTAVKGITMNEYHHNGFSISFRELNSLALDSLVDIDIVYNSNMLDEFSFNLDGEATDKYDFVTLALRDIAQGMGFGHRITASSGTLSVPEGLHTPYEEKVFNVIGMYNPSYEKATSGSLHLNGYHLYSPNPFDNSKSLRFFHNESNSPLERLLTPEFKKGYVVRDLTASSTQHSIYEDFRDMLYWHYGDVATGSSSTVTVDTDLNNQLPYKGAVSFSFGNSKSLSFNDITGSDDAEDAKSPRLTFFTDTNAIKYGPCNIDQSLSNATSVYTVAVQQKDGVWQLLDCQSMSGSDVIQIDLDALDAELETNDTTYARTVDGGLKYRLVSRTIEMSNYTRENYKVKYFTRAYTPQKPVIKYSKVHEEESSLVRMSDDYYIDVEIGISNIEGTTEVLVEQLDEGMGPSFYYYADDFRKGYFIANLDRECTTQLSVISYNDNGYKRSETITIPPLGYPEQQAKLKPMGSYVEVCGLRDNTIESGKIRYQISSPLTLTTSVPQILSIDRRIDIANLDRGIYILTLMREEEVIATCKIYR